METKNKAISTKCPSCSNLLKDTGDRIGVAQEINRTTAIREPNQAYSRCENCGYSEKRKV